VIRAVFKSVRDPPHPFWGWLSGWIPSLPTQSSLTCWYTCRVTEQKWIMVSANLRSCLNSITACLWGLLFSHWQTRSHSWPSYFLRFLWK
jgi:hypothetical protein